MSDNLVKRLRQSWDADRSIMSQTERWMAERKEAADRIEELEAKLAKAVEALEAVLNACDQGRMTPVSGAGGMTVESNIRGSIYVGVPAWPIEEARATLTELKGETE